ncbi:MAG: hypothetical protein OXF31_13120 [Gammaproteobacteria bacterium]|nr:hypothetical protein [Gammaproteobacteria bacterium]
MSGKPVGYAGLFRKGYDGLVKRVAYGEHGNRMVIGEGLGLTAPAIRASFGQFLDLGFAPLVLVRVDRLR